MNTGKNEEKFEERFEDIEVYYGTDDIPCELNLEKAEKKAVIEFIRDEISTAISRREKEIVEKVIELPAYRLGDGSYVSQVSVDDVISIIKN